MNQIISSLAAAAFLALAAFMVRSSFAVILLSLASGCAWIQYIPGLSYQWQVRAASTGLVLYAFALLFVAHAWSDQI